MSLISSVKSFFQNLVFLMQKILIGMPDKPDISNYIQVRCYIYLNEAARFSGISTVFLMRVEESVI